MYRFGDDPEFEIISRGIGMAGEFGHIRISGWKSCHRKKIGCLETVSGRAIEKVAGKPLQDIIRHPERRDISAIDPCTQH